ncbi:putative filamentous haemagglutinin, intein-containing protein [Campylobacter sputorum subsp. bubulus]|uniref:Putative filamentous haemagglutinin, intein-containing protein n=1 Tax=Campylobacter sputorum subsp. sputorum TaxID=32024 RepID=A0A381DHN7_9BACT|nr:hypothetical protein [Campylobacter sputorum]ASM35178.1 hypothetical protein CSPUT_0965 [Campylobacter sputorum aubsp. sputorum RM3237]KAB0581015.1 hypothetical protein F7P64_07810 [Campylobacter sputorum subsp. sputorum]SUX08824.1 putative filamentous haemagglutinin, intein-containing protein [Campylobacter sputorum subsp. bubulus]SUX10006.1 putative filamentous haemagglutinin, intein-containing protein [Campylobacter sputorum subsp. sputorum]
MLKFLNLIFLATLLLSSNLLLTEAIIDEDKGANKGYNLATSSEVYNRQLHKDEEEFLNKHSKEFKSYYETQTGKTLTDSEAKSLLFLSGRYIVDAKENGTFNILNFFGKTDFSKDELNTGINFIYQKSQGLKFIDHYKENFTPTNFFSVTDEQFYNHSYNPNTPQGLSDMSFMFIPMGKTGKFNKNIEVNIITDNKAKKIFGTREGHIIDTPQNRELLINVANDTKLVLGKDKFGNTWSAKLLDNGEQVWTQTRNGQIINGGINKTPKNFNSETGLSSPIRPNWK